MNENSLSSCRRELYLFGRRYCQCTKSRAPSGSLNATPAESRRTGTPNKCGHPTELILSYPVCGTCAIAWIAPSPVLPRGIAPGGLLLAGTRCSKRPAASQERITCQDGESDQRQRDTRRYGGQIGRHGNQQLTPVHGNSARCAAWVDRLSVEFYGLVRRIDGDLLHVTRPAKRKLLNRIFKIVARD